MEPHITFKEVIMYPFHKVPHIAQEHWHVWPHHLDSGALALLCGNM